MNLFIFYTPPESVQNELHNYCMLWLYDYIQDEQVVKIVYFHIYYMKVYTYIHFILKIIIENKTEYVGFSQVIYYSATQFA